MDRGGESSIDDTKYSREFKAQLNHKVLSKIEKRFYSTGELSEAETKCFKEAQLAV